MNMAFRAIRPLAVQSVCVVSAPEQHRRLGGVFDDEAHHIFEFVHIAMFVREAFDITVENGGA